MERSEIVILLKDYQTACKTGISNSPFFIKIYVSRAVIKINAPQQYVLTQHVLYGIFLLREDFYNAIKTKRHGENNLS